MNARLIPLGLLLLLVSASCRNPAIPGGKADPAVVRIGTAAAFVEFARTEEQRETGLMFRETLATNAGMVFVFEPSSIPAFYMKNTGIPLDILFVDEGLRIVDVQQMEPFDERNLHRPPSPVMYAIELNRGWAASHGVRPGDRIEFGGR